MFFININILFGGYFDSYTSELDTQLFCLNCLYFLWWVQASMIDHDLISLTPEVVPCRWTAQAQR